MGYRFVGFVRNMLCILGFFFFVRVWVSNRQRLTYTKILVEYNLTRACMESEGKKCQLRNRLLVVLVEGHEQVELFTVINL